MHFTTKRVCRFFQSKRELKELSQAEANSKLLHLGRARKNLEPRGWVYYESGTSDYARIASTIANHVSDWSTVLFLIESNPFGWPAQEHMSSARYEPWLKSGLAVLDSFNSAPPCGFEFERAKQSQFESMFVLALTYGWDVHVVFSPGRLDLYHSHDNRIEIWRGSNWRGLLEAISSAKA
jgi:hypothetical protein